MRATLTQDGTLTITPDSELEAYALSQWGGKRKKGKLVVKTAYEPVTSGTIYSLSSPGISAGTAIPWPNDTTGYTISPSLGSLSGSMG